ncbi:MAG: YcaO-like family protein [Janthinobacterium lividum]
MTDTLEQVAAAYRAALPAEGTLSMMRIDGLDRTGVPVVQANLLLPGLPLMTGHGYGFEPIEGEVGAVGELCEEVHCNAWLAQNRGIRASYAEMVASHGRDAVVDPLTLCLPAGSDYAPDRTLTWVEGRRLSKAAVWLPMDWIASHGFDLDHAPELITPITNGLGAGFDLDYAIGHGIMELLQRDGNVIGYRALDQGLVIELDAVPDPMVRGLLDHLEALGIHVTAKLAATDFGMTNLYVVGDDDAPGSPLQVTACGEASHPDRDRALRKALLEFCGSRARKVATHGTIEECRRVMPAAHVDQQLDDVQLEHEEPRALQAMAEWLDQDAASLRARLTDTVFSHRRTLPLSSLPQTGADTVSKSTDRLRVLERRLADDGLEALYVAFRASEEKVQTVKVVVPGLESETMSYHRIGWRGVRRLRDRNDPMLLDAPRDGALPVRMRPEDEVRAGGPAWFDAARADRIVDRLYPLYREPGCFAAQILRSRRAENHASGSAQTPTFIEDRDGAPLRI